MLQANEKVNGKNFEECVPQFGPPDEPPFAGESSPPRELPVQTVIRGLGVVDKKQVFEIIEEKIFKLCELFKNKNFESLVTCLKDPTLYDLINAANDMTSELERGMV